MSELKSVAVADVRAVLEGLAGGRLIRAGRDAPGETHGAAVCRTVQGSEVHDGHDGLHRLWRFRLRRPDRRVTVAGPST